MPRLSTLLRITLALGLLGVAHAPPAAIAQTQATEQDREIVRRQLFASLKAAPNETTARQIEARIWAFWTTGPTTEASALLADAMSRRQSFDYAGSIAALDALVENAPEWSEAWNQRAFSRFLREEYEASLADIEKTLELEPNHFGALAGKADILFRLGRKDDGQAVLREAVEIHPWLGMRVLLEEPTGRDI